MWISVKNQDQPHRKFPKPSKAWKKIILNSSYLTYYRLSPSRRREGTAATPQRGGRHTELQRRSIVCRQYASLYSFRNECGVSACLSFPCAQLCSLQLEDCVEIEASYTNRGENPVMPFSRPRTRSCWIAMIWLLDSSLQTRSMESMCPEYTSIGFTVVFETYIIAG